MASTNGSFSKLITDEHIGPCQQAGSIGSFVEVVTQELKQEASASSSGDAVHRDHVALVDAISEYERSKEPPPSVSFLVKLREPSHMPHPELAYPGAPYNRGDWSGFVQTYQFFTKFAVEAQSYKNRYIVYPNLKGELMNPQGRYLYGKAPAEGFMVEYDFRNKILAMDLYQVVMLDYDLKEEWTSREEICSFLEWTAIQAKAAGYPFALLLFPSDRGVHAFVVSESYQRSLFWVDFMLAMRNDAHYTAFSYARGFGARLTAKPDHPDDRVCWMSPLNPEEDETIDVNFPCTFFFSKYLQREIVVKIFTRDFVDGLLLIGDKTAIKSEILYKVLLHYLLVQFGRSFSEAERLQIEKDIYGQNIYPFPDRMSLLREDVKTLYEMSLQVSF